VVAVLCERGGEKLKKGKERAHTAEVALGGKRLALAVPQTWMNESGQAAAPLVRRFGVPMDRLVVVHDELDLPVGTVKIKVGGGLAGHNGLKSLKAHLHSDEFLRIRVGIGRPPGRQDAADFVLKRPGKADRTELDIAVSDAADMIETILASDAETAMARHH
jgi:PTH1 family peptidyl-tRNA hydrolase